MKQRLIGAAVLLALGVIFIPMILDGTGNPVLRKIPPIPRALDAVDPGTLVIPSAPPIQAHAPIVVQQAVKPVNTASAPKPATKADKKLATKTATSKPKASPKAPQKSVPVEKPAKKQANKPAKKPVKQPASAVATAASPEKIRAWTVQVGSFNTSQKALKLRSSLRTKGFKAYVDKIRTQGKTYYRVRVGPVLNRKDAVNSLNNLKKTGQSSAYVVRHP